MRKSVRYVRWSQFGPQSPFLIDSFAQLPRKEAHKGSRLWSGEGRRAGPQTDHKFMSIAAYVFITAHSTVFPTALLMFSSILSTLVECTVHFEKLNSLEINWTEWFFKWCRSSSSTRSSLFRPTLDPTDEQNNKLCYTHVTCMWPAAPHGPTAESSINRFERLSHAVTNYTIQLFL